jgi:uncharacterized protein YqgC (DUF456 family)
MTDVLLWVLTLLLFGVGLVGVFIPILPGIAFVFVGILFYAFMTNFSAIGVGAVVMFGLISFIAWLIEYAGGIIGARLGGGQKKALWGTLGGGLIGLFIGGPLWLVPGLFVGALIGALYEGKTLAGASKAAFFSLLGVIGAKVIQMILAIGMVVAFLGVVLF